VGSISDKDSEYFFSIYLILQAALYHGMNQCQKILLECQEWPTRKAGNFNDISESVI
jgi:hypothetical protein